LKRPKELKKKTWTEIKIAAKKSVMEDSCGSPMLRGGMTGYYYYYYYY
jgi:hypothetical protein